MPVYSRAFCNSFILHRERSLGKKCASAIHQRKQLNNQSRAYTLPSLLYVKASSGAKYSRVWPPPLCVLQFAAWQWGTVWSAGSDRETAAASPPSPAASPRTASTVPPPPPRYHTHTDTCNPRPTHKRHAQYVASLPRKVWLNVSTMFGRVWSVRLSMVAQKPQVILQGSHYS